MSQAFAALQSFLLKSSGLSLDREKQYLVEARLNPVIQQAGLKSLHELVARLETDRALAKKVTEAMTVNETFFFRDRAAFRGVPQCDPARTAENARAEAPHSHLVGRLFDGPGALFPGDDPRRGGRAG